MPKRSILNRPGTSQIQQNKALSQNENVPHGGKFISDEERIEQQINHHHFNIDDITRNLTRRDESWQHRCICLGGTPRKIGWGCAARLPKPLPHL